MMQDNIPDALIAAFERQYDTNWNDPQLRNERMAMRYGWAAAMESKQCLVQIGEPADERAAFEAAASDNGKWPRAIERDANGNYLLMTTASGWSWWQARAALAATPATTDEPPFLQRLRTEQHDLSERHQKISVFIVSPAFQMLTDDDKGLLRKQEAQQHVLLQTLNQRIHSASEKHMREKNNG